MEEVDVNIKTTLYMNAEFVDMIEKMADMTGKTRTELIILLMKRMMKHNSWLARAHQPVRYQVTLPQACWRRLHITVCSRDYEQCLDMRKFFKMSVSFLVAYAVEHYLDELIELIMNGGKKDNYQYNYYFIIQKTDNCSVCWKVVWGMPDNPNDLLV